MAAAGQRRAGSPFTTENQEAIAARGVETGIVASVRDDLATRGHQIQVVPKIAGGMNGVRFDHAAGCLHGAACWRADGAPVGLSGGPARVGVLDPMYQI